MGDEQNLCDFPGCAKLSIETVGGVSFCSEHESWALQLLQDIENRDESDDAPQS